MNAFLVCRIVPALTQNYLNMIREAHEDRDADTQITAFEDTFSIMGKMPFIGSSFNDVLPPPLLAFFLLNLGLILARQFGGDAKRRLELFSLLELLEASSREFSADEEREARGIIAQVRRLTVKRFNDR